MYNIIKFFGGIMKGLALPPTIYAFGMPVSKWFRWPLAIVVAAGLSFFAVTAIIAFVTVTAILVLISLGIAFLITKKIGKRKSLVLNPCR